MNPRGGLSPPTRLAGEHLRPLGQPSGARKYTSGPSDRFRAAPPATVDYGRCVTPVEALERIAELLMRGPRAGVSPTGVPHAARARSRACPTTSCAVPRRRGPAAATCPASARRPRRSSPRRSRARRPQYLHEPARRHAGDAGTDAGEALRAHSRATCTSHSDWSDGGDTIAAMAEKARDARPRVLRAHRPLAAAEDRERARRRPAARAARRRRGAERGARAVPHPHRRRGRHPRRRRARRSRGAARARRRRRRQRALEAAHGGGRDDAAHGRRDREPARRRARSLHRPACSSGGAVRSRSSTTTS